MLKLEPGPEALSFGLGEEYHFTQAEWMKMREVAKERGTVERFCSWQKNKFIVIQTTANERMEIVNGEIKEESKGEHQPPQSADHESERPADG